jgi:hypothetical protein
VTEAQQAETIRFAYVARTRLKVGNTWREPGDEVPEARDWPPHILQAYLGAGQIEIPLPKREEPVATYAPAHYDELKPTPPPLVGQQSPDAGVPEGTGGADLIEVDCTNCRGGGSGSESLNYVPSTAVWFQCWFCGQQQRVSDALRYPPQSWDEWQRAGFRPATGRR